MERGCSLKRLDTNGYINAAYQALENGEINSTVREASAHAKTLEQSTIGKGLSALA